MDTPKPKPWEVCATKAWLPGESYEDALARTHWFIETNRESIRAEVIEKVRMQPKDHVTKESDPWFGIATGRIFVFTIALFPELLVPTTLIPEDSRLSAIRAEFDISYKYMDFGYVEKPSNAKNPSEIHRAYDLVWDRETRRAKCKAVPGYALLERAHRELEEFRLEMLKVACTRCKRCGKPGQVPDPGGAVVYCDWICRDNDKVKP